MASSEENPNAKKQINFISFYFIHIIEARMTEARSGHILLPLLTACKNKSAVKWFLCYKTFMNMKNVQNIFQQSYQSAIKRERP